MGIVAVTDESLIHLRVPADLKGRWVRESRAAGMRLTDWIIQRVERTVTNPMTTIAIPDGVEFEDLRLARNPVTGDVSFDWRPIERICEASGLDVSVFRDGPEDNLANLINTWYRAHLAQGGAPDTVQDELITEVRIEDERGHGFSYPPGRA